MSVELDHLMFGAPSLDSGVAAVERLLGVTPAPGGAHPGGGTRNALLALGPSVYLEVIAPDPAQDPVGTFGERLGRLSEAGLVTWAVRASDLDHIAAVLAERGVESRPPVTMRRRTPAGEALEWSLLFPGGHPFGVLVPFFIDWRNSPHPASTNPEGGRLKRFEIETPDDAPLRDLLGALGLDVQVRAADTARLLARIETPTGEVVLESAAGTAGGDFSL